MQGKKKLTEDLQHLGKISTKNAELAQKLDEFIALLENSDIDSENIKDIKKKVDSALDQKLNSGELIKEIKEISLLDIGKLDQLNQLENLLNNNYLDSRQVRNSKIKEGLGRMMTIIIGFLFVTFGFAMIIIPAPPYFELFTIFYFNQDDGVTLMDLISLIIVATGIFIVIRSMLNTRKYE